MSNVSNASLPLVIINGESADTLSVYDRAFQYGDGLFETIAILDGTPALLDKHLQRLQHGLQILAFPPVDIDGLAQQIRQLSGQFQRAVLKLTITRGLSKRGYKPPETPSPNIVLSFSQYDLQQSIQLKQPVSVRLCQAPVSINPALAGIKHLNRLDQVLARGEWHDDKYAEGIMCDPDGHVIEATSANLFLWKDNTLFTPDLSRCGIAGVVRELVMETAKTLSLTCKVQDISIEQCHHADAMFITNSLAGITPVSRFESTTFNQSSWPGELFDRVMQHVYS